MMRFFSTLAALLGAIAVIMGALGSHYLQLGDSAKAYQTAVYYQLFHALLVIALLGLTPKFLSKRQMLFTSAFLLFGVVLFSGSIYLLTIFQLRQVGFITPIGGLSLITGWLALCWAFMTKKHD